MYSNSLLVNNSYDDLRSQMQRCKSAEKFWSFVLKLPNRPPYGNSKSPLFHSKLSSQGLHGEVRSRGRHQLFGGREGGALFQGGFRFRAPGPKKCCEWLTRPPPLAFPSHPRLTPASPRLLR